MDAALMAELNGFSRLDLAALHRRSLKNLPQLGGASGAACFHCLRFFPVERIFRWTDEGLTALCPHCAVDAVLPVSPGFPVSPELLGLMHRVFFED